MKKNRKKNKQLTTEEDSLYARNREAEKLFAWSLAPTVAFAALIMTDYLFITGSNSQLFSEEITRIRFLVSAIFLVFLVVNFFLVSRRTYKRTVESINDLVKFRAAVDSSYNHIVITDPEGIVLYANQGAERISGYKKEEMVGKKAGGKDLGGGYMDEKFYRNLWSEIKDKKKSISVEIKNKRKRGDFYVGEYNISPVLGRGSKLVYFVSVGRDVTKLKEIDRAKTEFVSLASHQLRTPISIVNWYAELLLEGENKLTKEKKEKYLNQIRSSGKRMDELIDVLLNVSRIEMGTFDVNLTDIDVKALIESVLSEVKVEAGQRKQKIGVKYGKDISKLRTDEAFLKMVILNLLTNAIKYTPNKGSINLDIHNVKKGKKIGGKKTTQESILITVTDTGYGIPASEKDRIFEKLFRADNAKKTEAKGNGLGLYIAKSFIERVGGRIWFESELNKGTTFYILIPTKGK